MTMPAMPSQRAIRPLAYAGLVLVLAGAGASLVPEVSFAAPLVLTLALTLVMAATWILGRARQTTVEETDEGRFRRELTLHSGSLVLTVLFLLLALVEALAVPAAFGQLRVFGEFALGFISLYPFLIALLLSALVVLVLLAARSPAPKTRSANDTQRAYAMLGITSLFVLASLAVGMGAFASFGVRAERSVFVLAAALVTLFFFLRIWLQLPKYGEITDWLEREEHLKTSGLLRNLVYAMSAVAAGLLLLALLATLGVVPPSMGIVGVGLAMLALMGATFNVGVSHVVPALEIGIDNAQEQRKIRRVLLNTTTLVLTGLSLTVGTITLLALLAQVGGVEVFKFLLEAFVTYYPFIFAIALIPLIGAVIVRTRVQTEITYSDELKAAALGFSTVAIVLVFFGVFIGSGLAQGTGIEIENAVLVMGAAFLALVQFVKARALLPGIIGMLRDAIKTSEEADVDTKETIKKRMVLTYVFGLLFVFGFTAYFAATSLGVVEAPGSSLGTDVAFFIYILAGVGLLALVALRYFQGVNIDPAWAKKKQKQDIGKRRLTSQQVTRYLILGFSVGIASILFIIGVLVSMGIVPSIGPWEIEKKYGTDFFVFAILLGLGPYGWYHSHEAARIASINAKFPEFLRDLAESQRSGMTLTEAVITASKGSYGVLTDEVRKMAVQIEWGVSFSDALSRFAKRVDTQLIQRTVSLVIQASNAGGNVVDVLTAAADDSREIQMILKERKQAMSIYVMIIYIAFAVFIGVIAILNAQFIPEVAKAVKAADGVSIGGLNFRAFDEQEFKTIFFHAAIIQGFGGGLVAGVMSGGKPVNGMRHSFILVLIGWVLFRLVIG